MKCTMSRFKLFSFLKTAYRLSRKTLSTKYHFVPVTYCLLSTVRCEDNVKPSQESWDANSLDHEFLIRQATTCNVNAATQLLTVTIVAIQDTSERLRDVLAEEIFLMKQAMEWGDATPPNHWDQLVAIRGSLSDLKHNLSTLFGYMDYAEKLATIAAEISYSSGNTTASDAICQRIDHASRTCKTQMKLNQELQQESLELQQQAIIQSPDLEEKLTSKKPTKK
ncbi:uncharacterized protein LOC126970538 [Leptidea sinapis]|uniref:Direct IAP-binding protein with low pI n=1 Tax=Leptidea sinapis TaxID=189913 RepID=A0A5E4PXX2_9NEOP|nr:uncharacterized protein LOC126970538 [Leptidea sinapis]VVC90115.1 unnamed protein product [Leptidea sinapis]